MKFILLFLSISTLPLFSMKPHHSLVQWAEENEYTLLGNGNTISDNEILLIRGQCFQIFDDILEPGQDKKVTLFRKKNQAKTALKSLIKFCNDTIDVIPEEHIVIINQYFQNYENENTKFIISRTLFLEQSRNFLWNKESLTYNPRSLQKTNDINPNITNQE